LIAHTFFEDKPASGCIPRWIRDSSAALLRRLVYTPVCLSLIFA